MPGVIPLIADGGGARADLHHARLLRDQCEDMVQPGPRVGSS